MPLPGGMLRHAALLVLSLAVVGLVALSYRASAEHRAELVGGYEDGAANYYGVFVSVKKVCAWYSGCACLHMPRSLACRSCSPPPHTPHPSTRPSLSRCLPHPH
jgi:hypothetical protein